MITPPSCIRPTTPTMTPLSCSSIASAKDHRDLRTASCTPRVLFFPMFICIDSLPQPISQPFQNPRLFHIQTQIIREPYFRSRNLYPLAILIIPSFLLFKSPLPIRHSLLILNLRPPQLQRRPPIYRKLPLHIINHQPHRQHQRSPPHHQRHKVPPHGRYHRLSSCQHRRRATGWMYRASNKHHRRRSAASHGARYPFHRLVVIVVLKEFAYAHAD